MIFVFYREVIDVDKEMSKYNVEEFYGIEYIEEEDEEVTLPSREELLPISLNSECFSLNT